MLDVISDEREILIKDEASKLEDRIEKKMYLAGKIKDVDNMRQEMFSGKKLSDFVRAGILKKSDADRFIKLVNTVEEENETNMALTEQSLSYIRFVKSALNLNPAALTYKNSGKIDSGETGSIFTKKA